MLQAYRIRALKKKKKNELVRAFFHLPLKKADHLSQGLLLETEMKKKKGENEMQ